MLQLSQMSLDLTLQIARGVFLVSGFVLAAVAFIRWRRASEHSEYVFLQQNEALLARLNALEKQLTASDAQITGARQEIATLAALAGQLQDSEQRRTSVPAAAGTPSYQIAIRLARSGARREELMSSCGLTRQEADLVQRLHAPARTTKLAAAS